MRFIHILFLILLSLSEIYPQQKIPCDDRLIISLYPPNSPPNYSYWIDVQGSTINFTDLATYQGLFFNALGYNRIDNYMYAFQQESNNVLRLFSDGSYEVAGQVPGLGSSTAGAGDCSPQGYYAFKENQSNTLLFFDVVDGFEQVASIPLFWGESTGNSGTFTPRVDDIAFDPFIPGVAYTFQRNYPGSGSGPISTQGALLRINVDLDSPEAGQVDLIGFVPSDVVIHIGALFFGKNGNLFGYGSLDGLPNLTQNRLVHIDKNTGNATLIGTGPGATGNDGCSCPYGIIFDQTTTQEIQTCDEPQISFSFSIEARHQEVLNNLILTDTFPEGSEIISVSTNLPGVVSSTTASNILEITTITLAPDQAYFLDITLSVSNLPAGNYENQAFIKELPSTLGVTQRSNNTETILQGDPNPFIVIGGSPTDVLIQNTSPSSCFSPFNSTISLSWPTISPGSTYQINILNEAGQLLEYNISTDDNSIIIQGLAPGSYVLQLITSEEECIYPNNPMFEVASNSNTSVNINPSATICINDTALLAATIEGNPDSIQWFGPQGFLVNGDTLLLSVDSTTLGGIYTVIVHDGVCSDSAELTLTINDAPNLHLPDTILFCQGQEIKIELDSPPPSVTYEVFFSNELLAKSNSSIVVQTNMISSGQLLVSANNGDCVNTSSIWMEELPPIKVMLPNEMAFECSPISITPITQGGTGNYAFVWSPATNLSCMDCLSPVVLSPETNNYQLIITDTQAVCSDTATVTVNYDNSESIYVPNAFSPNNDGVNDFFRPFSNCEVEKVLEFSIYNRWGGLVFQKTGFPLSEFEGWNGTLDGKQLTPGIFVWVLDVLLPLGNRQQYTGDVMLIR